MDRVLSRYRLAKLTWLDRPTGRVIRRYERERPGELVHGGGHRVANAWFAARGITVERVLTDNGSCYRSKAFAAALGDDVKHTLQPGPPVPQTNGKVERYHRTYADEWALKRLRLRHRPQRRVPAPADNLPHHPA